MITEKQQVHNLIILDESGSMESIKTTIISGFNELVQSIKVFNYSFQSKSISYLLYHLIVLVTKF
jgi:hypothetical protein